ncbi:hypothetical protein J6590_087396 [Homalodisca vitripennis]|nr:hypothetical protein J6590_087396 [Homalodisca vitripennis]
MNLRVGRSKQEFEEVSVGGAVSEEAKPTPAPGIKREGNASQWSGAKQSRRTTSLLNLFMPNSQGFLRSRREKRKEKKAKKKKDGSQDNTSNKDEKSDIKEKEDGQKSKTPTPEVDEEGYCIRPKLDPWDHEKGSFYSSSDTDSKDEREQKIHVEIKPLGNGTGPISASVDELRATVENISLSPLGTATGRRGSNAEDHTMKRSQSVSQQIGGGKLNNDLVGLNLFQSPVGSSASTPTGSHPYAPLQSPTLTSANSPAPVNNNRYSDLQDLFQEVGVIQPSTVDTKQRQTPTIAVHRVDMVTKVRLRWAKGPVHCYNSRRIRLVQDVDCTPERTKLSAHIIGSTSRRLSAGTLHYCRRHYSSVMLALLQSLSTVAR